MPSSSLIRRSNNCDAARPQLQRAARALAPAEAGSSSPWDAVRALAELVPDADIANQMRGIAASQGPREWGYPRKRRLAHCIMRLVVGVASRASGVSLYWLRHIALHACIDAGDVRVVDCAAACGGEDAVAPLRVAVFLAALSLDSARHEALCALYRRVRGGGGQNDK